MALGLGAPPLIWLAVFFLAPMGLVLAYSFGTDASLTTIQVTGTLDNYAHALQPLYLHILGQSFGFALTATLICLVAGYPAALAIAFAPPRAKPWLLMGVMLPFWTNLLIRTYALMALLRPAGLLHSDAAVVLGLVYVQLPFMVLPLYAALERLDRSLIEAALDLGASRAEVFARVVLPLSAPGIASGVVVTLIPCIGAYLSSDLLGGPSSLMISNIIERQFRSADDWPFGSALSFLLMDLTFAALLAQAWLAGRRRREAQA